MVLSTVEFVRAKEAVNRVLELLELEAYLFEVEPQEVYWRVRVECAVREGWQSCVLLVPKERLALACSDETARQELAAEWHRRLAACKSSKAGKKRRRRAARQQALGRYSDKRSQP